MNHHVSEMFSPCIHLRCVRGEAGTGGRDHFCEVARDCLGDDSIDGIIAAEGF